MASRLAELQASRPPPAPGTAVVHMPTAASFSSPADTDQLLEQFYRLVAEVQTLLREIQNKTQEVQVKHAEQMRSPDVEASKRVFADIQDLMQDINNSAAKTRDKLKEMEEGTKKLGETPEDAAGNSAVIKIQQNQHAHLSRTFAQTMKDYQDVQDENKRNYEEQTARQIRIKCTTEDGQTIDDEEAKRLAREMLVTGSADQIFSQSKEHLAQIIETRNDIYAIEQSMRELNQLFTDLATLVNEQGELMDQVLINVQTSVKYVEKGRKDQQAAKKYMKAGRKKKCWLIILLFIILIFILAPVLGLTIG